MGEAGDRVFCGTIVHSTLDQPMVVMEGMALGVKAGKVVFLEREDKLEQLLAEHGMDAKTLLRLQPRQFVMPGLVDCHIHAPQLPIAGVGTDRGLLDWLATYTYPSEARYKDGDFAGPAHEAAVRRTLKSGTTLAAYYSTIHTDTTMLLCQAAEKLGQRALIGKVNIDALAPDYYIETTQESIDETRRFIDEVKSLKTGLVTPVVTPRFAVCCTMPLMKQLAAIACEHDVPMQTHLSESRGEIETVMAEHAGQGETYTEVYDTAGLLGPQTILAHCIHLSDKELDILQSRDCGLVHCSCSNTTLRSGVMDLRRFIDKGLKLGLGTDLAGGYTPSMLGALRHTVDASNHVAIRRAEAVVKGEGDGEDYARVTMAEAFRLATLGGSQVLGQNCGNFEAGREFDGLLVDPEVSDSPLDLFHFDTQDHVVHKFLYTGDDRNIVRVYVRGREVVNRDTDQ